MAGADPQKRRGTGAPDGGEVTGKMKLTKADLHGSAALIRENG